MTLKILRSVLGWCTVINMGLLLVWFASFKIGIFLLNLVPYLALRIGGIEEKSDR